MADPTKQHPGRSAKNHPVKNALKRDAGGAPDLPGGAKPQHQNDLADTPLNPRDQGQGHQRQP